MTPLPTATSEPGMSIASSARKCAVGNWLRVEHLRCNRLKLCPAGLNASGLDKTFALGGARSHCTVAGLELPATADCDSVQRHYSCLCLRLGRRLGSQ
jgi:hypothetical protein